MNMAQKIARTYALLALPLRFELLLLLAGGPLLIDELNGLYPRRYGALYDALTKLRDGGLLAVERLPRVGSGARPIRYSLSDRVRVAEDQVCIQVEGYEIPINRGLAEFQHEDTMGRGRR